ncbi:MAG: magnesium chelatase [marine actinobacterium MedAcidi-G3]|nr:MAG: magnesium chelatase [marine actinobacterium MedAcidi-G3]MAR53730.1 magnesium chelatase [Acidimicrobiaceae bacterium]MBA4813655.1 sigma 54-interacting transcriptional regulator [Acidimicrobiales bacterium]HCJ86445.1 magnesium chelatase [Acidimicrobiaceae bacterium]|tara:strand:+ start:1475 stop:2875 length:1401 start_codon:yes stop_codon:yes gene_type:complete
MTQPRNLGELKKSGWVSRPVKEEMRQNAVALIAAGEPLFDGVVGYENTVLPQLENAVLAGHDVIFLGERGQAKTRMIRSLVNLLDEWMPYIEGSEIYDDPYNPVSKHAKDLVKKRADKTPIVWAHRDVRFGEKLATPDTSIADLIGEVDPIKVAEGRYLSDELTLHYGMVPRTNRGIFAINELPDLAERIQVGLLNVLEERDVQIRGYKVQLPLDVLLVASANPEDYTNRGRMITPLKDRFGAQIRTHYPLEIDTEIDIAEQEAVPLEAPGLSIIVPEFMAEIIATFSHICRSSPQVNQRSGVSVRMTVTNYETLAANATRRALQAGENRVVPRVSDLDALMASSSGKIEIESIEEGREGQIVKQMLNAAVLEVFKGRFSPEDLVAVVESFDGGTVAHTGDDLGSAQYADMLAGNAALAAAVAELTDSSEPAELASAVELILEGLHLSKRLNKEAIGMRATYRGRG